MKYLPLANLMHYKLRSVLSAFGIAIGICMLLTLSGLARGTLYEIADRWEAVNADLIVFPRGWGDDASIRSGNGLWDSYARVIKEKHADIVQSVVPVFTWPIKLGGQDQVAAGVDPQNFAMLTAGRQIEGNLFDPQNRFAGWLEKQLLESRDSDNGFTDGELDLSNAPYSGLELVIDSRLAKTGGYRIGQTVRAADHDWKITGIVPAGVMTRVFMPRRTAQYLFGGSIQQSTLIFIKLKSGVSPGPACEQLKQTTSQDVVPLTKYRGMLKQKFSIMFRYVDAVNVISLVIAFLFIMVTLYMMVLQMRRDIAILKSSGAGAAFILRQVMAESVILTLGGTFIGIIMAFGAGYMIQTLKPLYTVTITLNWVLIAFGAAVSGAVISGIYPALQAMRVDMVEAITME